MPPAWSPWGALNPNIRGERHCSFLHHHTTHLRRKLSSRLNPAPQAANYNKMAQVITETGHQDMIHDAVLDYYGRRLATSSSDRTIRIFDIGPDNSQTLLTTLTGHDAPIFSLQFTHPTYGTILASASYAGTVLLHRESPPGTWTQIYTFALHSASVNSLSWAPHECGCVLACASSDGNVSVLEFRDPGTGAQGVEPETKVFSAHSVGANAVSWAPAFQAGAITSSNPATQTPVRRFATAGSDTTVKVWTFDPSSKEYGLTTTLTGHSDWVRDVAISPSTLTRLYVASASQDKTVRIWSIAPGEDISDSSKWSHVELSFECVVWRVSWNLSGNVLAVSGGDGKVSLWKEKVREVGWESVKTIEE